MIIRMMKDIADEYRGIDVEQRNRDKKEEQKKSEQEYRKNNFVPVWAKRSSITLAIFYILISVLYFIGAYQSRNILSIILTAILLICALVGAGLMNTKNKKMQKYGCGIFMIFLIIQIIRTLR